MTEQEIQVFIDGAKHYFNTLSARPATIGVPYLISHERVPCHDYTGIIGVSGERKGCVYFTAPRILLRHLLLSLGEATANDALLRDLVGEVANTISGNARSCFGSGFMISVPVVVQGAPQRMQLPRELNAIVVPVHWWNYSGSLVVCLQ